MNLYISYFFFINSEEETLIVVWFIINILVNPEGLEQSSEAHRGQTFPGN